MDDPQAHRLDATDPAPTDAVALTEVVVARLCHDLSGSLGAVLNGLELAGSNPGLAAEALQLAGDAAREVAARLRFARAIWSRETPLATAELPQIAEGLPNRARLQLDCADLASGTLAPGAARLVLAALGMAADAVHGPGFLTIAGEPDGDIMIAIAGSRAAWPASLAALIGDPDAGWADAPPRDLFTGLTVLLARSLGGRVSLLLSTGAAAGPPPLLIALPR